MAEGGMEGFGSLVPGAGGGGSGGAGGASSSGGGGAGGSGGAGTGGSGGGGTGAGGPGGAGGRGDDRERSAWRGGAERNRIGEHRLVVVFALLFLLIAGAAVLVAVLKQPPAPKAVCPKHQECPNPPRRQPTPTFNASTSPRLLFNQAFISPGLGYRFEYPSVLTTAGETSSNVQLVPANGGDAFIVSVEGAPSTQDTPQQLLDQTVSDLRNSIPDLQSDSDPNFQVLSPALGGRAGIGGFYQGNFDSPSGPVAPADVAILAASDGNETLAVAVMSANRAHTDGLFGFADQALLDTFRFSGDVVR